MLEWKQIAVIMDDTDASERVGRYAAALAREHVAHLLGVFGLSRDGTHHPSEGFARGADAISDVIEHAREAQAERAAAAGSRFATLMRDAGVNGEFRVVWRDVFDTDVLRRLHSDLIVAGYPKPRDLPEGWSAEHVLRTNGGPLLLIPSAWEGDTIGETVMIAWNASPKARRAVQDALPLLARAKRVTILIVDADKRPDRHGETPGAGIQAYLMRHDIVADLRQVSTDGTSTARTITDQAIEIGADLTVLGAYSRSRAAEFVFGGVTRSMLANVTQPLLIA